MLDAESRRRELQGVTSYPYVGNPLIGFSSPDPGFVSGKSGPRHHDGAHHSEEKQPFVNEDEPPMNTNRHED